MSIDNSILAHISQCRLLQATGQTAQRVVVAYSGGVDSSVLLHGLVAAARQSLIPINISSIVALHINHQLSPQADQWQQHCEQFAQQLGVTYYSQTVAIKNGGQGIEAAARTARYAIFEDYLQPSDCLVLGHHQQDQAETLLFRLCRGAGVKGLAAMPASRALGCAVLYRPLLEVSQQAIVQYAQQHQLTWVDDHSNVDDQYDRNFLRHQAIPLLQQRWSSLVSQLSTTAITMAQTQALLTEFAKEDFSRVDEKKARTGFSVNLQALAALSLPRRNNVLRYWCERHDVSLPTNEQLSALNQQFFDVELPEAPCELDELKASIVTSKVSPAKACVSWGRCEVRYFSGRLYLMIALPKFIAPPEIEWDGISDVDLQGAGMLRVVNKPSDVDCAYQKTHEKTTSNGISLTAQAYQIRWRQGGERCTPADRQHSQTVKKLLQEYQLETWLRDRVPLIYADDELVAVGDLWVNKGYELEVGNLSAVVQWYL
ncbi:tRNA lysidine(34) synthetase TilS [Eionea flava]